MKIILTIILFIGIFMLGYSFFSFGLSKAHSLCILSRVSNLRNEANYEKYQETMHDINENLNTIGALFKPMMWTGGVLTLCAILGLVVEVKRTKRHEQNCPTAGT